MKRFLLTAALITTLSGCSTMMNDRMTDVQVTSEPSGQHFSITDEDGQRVATGVTPAKVNLDAAAGFFDGQTYQVAYDKGPTVELDSHVTGWYWMGFIILPVTSAMLVDPISGDMFSLPDNVNGTY
jgi:uncharacterized protein YceK